VPNDAPRWELVQSPDGIDGLKLRFAVTRGLGAPTVRITGVYFWGEDLGTSHVRDITLSRYRDQFRQWLINNEQAAAVFGGEVDEDRADAYEITVAELESSSIPSHESVVRALPSLERVDGEAPAAFYGRVATAYLIAGATTRAPAVLLAEHAGVNPRTVHFWIREARRMGFLPPGRQGSAG
jgi:hypothetical protein